MDHMQTTDHIKTAFDDLNKNLLEINKGTCSNLQDTVIQEIIKNFNESLDDLHYNQYGKNVKNISYISPDHNMQKYRQLLTILSTLISVKVKDLKLL